MAVAQYGVNSAGKNVMFAFSLVTEDSPDSYEFIFRNFLTYMETPPKCVMLKRHTMQSPLFVAIKRVFS